MAQMRCIGISATACFTVCMGLYILATCANATILDDDDDFVNEDAKVWYAALMRSKPQFGFERGSRSHGKPTFIRFGKRDFSTYNPNFFNK
ncbi:unnamed protein product [Onchocerca flexuosa]|uniref:Neuropeptide-Like Protein n=2 Tax=Onchocerca flexuosa TaxID=387005 RepID=A0A183H3C2_9BILA|nr:unnamed protein product [Onchocerca flexuosa]